MSRAERWWRQPGGRPNRRPAVRSARRGRYAIDNEVLKAFDLGMDVGMADERQRSENRDSQLRRLIDAIHAADQGDPEPLAELGRQARGDNLLDVANAAGVTPMEVADGGQLLDELEAWLHEQ